MPLFTNHHAMHINARHALCPEPLCTQFLPAPRQCQYGNNQGKYYVAPTGPGTNSGISGCTLAMLYLPPNRIPLHLPLFLPLRLPLRFLYADSHRETPSPPKR
ncbi:hypothetical protein B0H14DRAFT_3449219 [Mycena olivaceomarginata]|nr:hypothetical protein B0H14DRAFT_3449219 [Mycena olivaceomarginata]